MHLEVLLVSSKICHQDDRSSLERYVSRWKEIISYHLKPRYEYPSCVCDPVVRGRGLVLFLPGTCEPRQSGYFRDACLSGWQAYNLVTGILSLFQTPTAVPVLGGVLGVTCTGRHRCRVFCDVCHCSRTCASCVFVRVPFYVYFANIHRVSAKNRQRDWNGWIKLTVMSQV